MSSVDGRLELAALEVAPLTRLLVTGANGAGKSTLLHVLAGALGVDRGVVHRRKGLRVQLLEQDVRFADPSRSPRELYERVLGERRAEQVPLAIARAHRPARRVAAGRGALGRDSSAGSRSRW